MSASALERTKTGPLQFGTDWPGVFIRGDEARSFAVAVRYAIDQLKMPESSVLSELAALLESAEIK